MSETNPTVEQVKSALRWRQEHWVVGSAAALALYAAECVERETAAARERIAELEQTNVDLGVTLVGAIGERDEALRARDLAREASNLDLEAKRSAEREATRLSEQLSATEIRLNTAQVEAMDLRERAEHEEAEVARLKSLVKDQAEALDGSVGRTAYVALALRGRRLWQALQSCVSAMQEFENYLAWAPSYGRALKAARKALAPEPVAEQAAPKRKRVATHSSDPEATHDLEHGGWYKWVDEDAPPAMGIQPGAIWKPPEPRNEGPQPNTGGHHYPGCSDDDFSFTSDCSYGCGCWMGGSRSGGPDGVDPFGECPNRAKSSKGGDVNCTTSVTTADASGDMLRAAPDPPQTSNAAPGSTASEPGAKRGWSEYMRQHGAEEYRTQELAHLRSRFCDEHAICECCSDPGQCVICLLNSTASDLSRERARADEEKATRIKYQDIVYGVCNFLDAVMGNSATRGEFVPAMSRNR